MSFTQNSEQRKNQELVRRDETLFEVFARTYTPPLPPLFDFMGDIKYRGGDTIEIFGDAATGKSELLMQFAVLCIMPPHYTVSECGTTLNLGGLDRDVAFIDLDYRLNLLRLALIIRSHIRKQWEKHCYSQNNPQSQPLPSHDEDTFVMLCMSRLMVRDKCAGWHNVRGCFV